MKLRWFSIDFARFQEYRVIIFLNIVFVLAISADPDKTASRHALFFFCLVCCFASK